MRKLLTISLGCFLLAGAPLQAAESAETLTQQIQNLARELKILRLDLCRLQLQQIAFTTAPLQQELHAIQTRLARIEADTKTAHERQAAVHQQWNDNLLTPEERREMEQIEKNVAGGENARLASDRERLLRRESELTQQNQLQLRKWNNISTAAATLEAELRNAPRVPLLGTR